MQAQDLKNIMSHLFPTPSITPSTAVSGPNSAHAAPDACVDDPTEQRYDLSESEQSEDLEAQTSAPTSSTQADRALVDIVGALARLLGFAPPPTQIEALSGEPSAPVPPSLFAASTAVASPEGMTPPGIYFDPVLAPTPPPALPVQLPTAYSSPNTDATSTYTAPTYATSTVTGATSISALPISTATAASTAPPPNTEAANSQRASRAQAMAAYGASQGMSAHDTHLMLAMAMQETDDLSTDGHSCGDWQNPKTGQAMNVGFMNFNVGMMQAAGISTSQIAQMQQDPDNISLAGGIFQQMLQHYGEAGLLAKQRYGIDAQPGDPDTVSYCQALVSTTAYLDQVGQKDAQKPYDGTRFAFNVSHC